MDKFQQAILSGLTECFDQIWMKVDDLSIEELRWTPSKSSNDIQWNIWHIARVEDRWINQRMKSIEEIWINKNKKFLSSNKYKDIFEFNVDKEKIQIQLENLILQPGINVISLDTDEFVLTETNREISFVVESIVMMN